MISVAFNRRLNPLGQPLKVMFGSDIGHWDVLDATSILSEAWSLVEAKLLSPDNFRDLTFVNPAKLHLTMNPDYLSGPPSRIPSRNCCEIHGERHVSQIEAPAQTTGTQTSRTQTGGTIAPRSRGASGTEGLSMHEMDFPTVEDLRRRTRRRIPKFAFDFVSGGCGENLTVARNRAAFDAIEIVPRYGRGALAVSTGVELFGRTYAAPLACRRSVSAASSGRAWSSIWRVPPRQPTCPMCCRRRPAPRSRRSAAWRRTSSGSSSMRLPATASASRAT